MEHPLARTKMTREPVTLRDVARLAGVHPMTVSNALKGTGRVAPATRDKVQRIAAELGYRPNLAARALVTGRTGTIAIALGPVNEHFYANLLHLLEAELTLQNYKMLFLRSRDVRENLLNTVEVSSVDGIIVVDVFWAIQDFLESAAGAQQPCVYAGVLGQWHIGASLIDNVAIDISGAVRQGIDIMLGAGCQRIAYLTSTDTMASFVEARPRIFAQVMKEKGRELEIINLQSGGNTGYRSVVREKLRAFILEHGCPDGLFCQNDEMAITAYRTLLDMGYRIPDDVLLVGCDGIQDTEYCDPPLSTVAQPVEKMCSLAWQFLQKRMAQPDRPLQQTSLPAELLVRKSLQRTP